MSTQILDGKQLKAMLIGGAEQIRSQIDEINDLNVFPVPDGDTGTNMTKTIEGGISEINSSDSESVASVMERFAHGVLLGARGNSGVILSQIFAGIKEELEKYDKVNARILSDAYKKGIEKSYASVVNPTEGTILTVFREATEYAAKKITDDSSIDDFYSYHVEEARRSLEKTKELLPVLAEADVVDSGAAGYLCISVGMLLALTGKIESKVYKMSTGASEATVDISLFTRDSVLEFGYCTEFLLRLQSTKVDADAFDPAVIIERLTSLGGESIVAYKTDDIVKVHVHTFDPGAILSACRDFGEFLTVKVENMSLGHSEEPEKKKSPKIKKKIATLAVASGDGISALFTEMGADGIISGGQTNNPSAEEFISAFEKCNAENIFVLPNNKNVMLAARQAAELYKGAAVHIIPTATLMQGYSALQVITPGSCDVDSIIASAERAARGVLDAEVTRAVRDVTIGGVSVKTGDYISISGGAIASVADSPTEALLSMLADAPTEDYEIITLFVGRDIDDAERVSVTERIEELYPELELQVYIGGQELYPYYVSLE